MHLWVKSHFSFREGASSPAELIDRAAELGHDAIALTDRNGLYGVVRAHVRAKERGVRLLIGAEVQIRLEAPEGITDDPRLAARADRHDPRVLLLAPSRGAYAQLTRLLTRAQAREDKGRAWSTVGELRELGRAPSSGEDGLIALCPDPALLGRLSEWYRGRLWGVITRHHEAEDSEREARMRRIAAVLDVPLVGTTEVLYHERSRRRLQDVLSCIRFGATLATAGELLQPNAEHALLSPAELRERFADAPELMEAWTEIAERCSFSLDTIRYVYPAEALPSGRTQQTWLEELTGAGTARHYAAEIEQEGEIPADVRRQLTKELQIIADLDYGGYFLTMHEIVEFCRREAIYCQGRGSAANSAVCFCLGITAVDPVRMDLLFERFLSRERAEPPDIDLDIEHERREEVIQHVYQRYGRRHAAMVANVIRYRARSAVREVGKVLGIPATDIDAVARLIRHWRDAYSEDGFDPTLAEQSGLDPNAPTIRHLLALTSEIVDTPRHLGIHPGGFLLGSEPVDELVPVEPATMEERTVIQWDKYDVEALGLFKVDLLGLGALTCIRKSFAAIERSHGIRLDMAGVPTEEPETYAMCSAGDTIGVFQIESHAQMAMLPRLRPRTFYDLVIEVALVRPGPIQGDMVHPYLKRRAGEEPVEYPHPNLVRILKKTLGVPIFQEQVMKLAVAAAGYTPGEADQLRRDMAAWRSAGKIDQHYQRMVRAMVENDISPEFAERVFNQIRGFGEYGFPESHAASFTLLAYITAWLKRHYPASFTASLLNSQPMGFYRPATLVEDAKRHGVEVRAIDVTRSDDDCTLEARGITLDSNRNDRTGHGEPRHGEPRHEEPRHEARHYLEQPESASHAIRMGLRFVKGLNESERFSIVTARRGEPFASLADFIRRAGVSERGLVQLAEAGALDAFGHARRDALWQIRALVRSRHDALGIMGELTPQSQLSFGELSKDDAVLWDYRASNHSVRGHPLERFRPELTRHGLPSAREINRLRDGVRTRFLGLVICRQQPGTASGVNFYTLEDETGFVNLVLWKQVDEQFRTVARTAVLLGVTGTIQRGEGDVVHLIVEALWELPPVLAQATERLPAASRDFH